jgi:hypothetical protein
MDADNAEMVDRICEVWVAETAGGADEDLLTILVNMMNGIGGDMASLVISHDTNGGVNSGPLRGLVGSRLLQECCTLALRDHYDFSKAVTCALIILISADNIQLSDDIRDAITTVYLPQVSYYFLFLVI